MPIPVRILLVLFALVFCAGVCKLDYGTATQLWRAGQSEGWPTTPGVVTQRNLEETDDDDRALTYSFSVDGRRYEGHEYKPGPHLVMGNPWDEVRSELTVGTPVSVAYDPENPSDATLRPGVRPDMLRGMLVLVLFNTDAIVGVLCIWSFVLNTRQFKPSRDVRSTATESVAHLNDIPPWLVVGIFFHILTFLTAFLLMGVPAFVKKSDEVPASWWLDGAIWLVLLGVTVWFARHAPPLRAAVLREATLTVPDTPTGPSTVDLFRSTIRRVEVRSETRVVGRGGTETCTFYYPTLVLDVTDGPREICFAEYGNPRDAEALANWFHERLNLEAVELQLV